MTLEQNYSFSFASTVPLVSSFLTFTVQVVLVIKRLTILYPFFCMQQKFQKNIITHFSYSVILTRLILNGDKKHKKISPLRLTF